MTVGAPLALLAVPITAATAAGDTSAMAPVPVSARTTHGAVTVGRPLAVEGQAAAGARVTLEWRRAGGWQRVGATTAGADGSYRVPAPTWWIGTRRVRITATDPGTSTPASSQTTYAVAPTYRPKGRSRAFHRYVGENYWDPCSTITWRFNPRGGYAGSVRTIRHAIKQVSDATGLRFDYRGTTRKIAFRDSAAAAHVDLLISWATPRQVSYLSGSSVGSAMSMPGAGGYYVDGEMVLDRTQHLRHGFHTSGAFDWGQVMLHELGHVMGLEHVGSRDEIMYRNTTRATHRYGAGDLAGLRAVGAGRPCAGS